MARKDEEIKVRGLRERESGSGVWWIRYRGVDGVLRREKVGRKSDAGKLLINEGMNGVLGSSSQTVYVMLV
jgi:hypothetical protein